MPLSPFSWLLAASAVVIMGFSKTALPGAAILAVVLMAAAFPENAALSVGAMLPVLLVGDVLAVFWFRRQAQWGQLLRLAPFVLVGMVPGFLVLTWLGDNQLRPLLGWLILGMVVLEWFRGRLALKKLPERWWFAAVCGALAGFGTMVANAGGPVMNLFLLSQRILKEQFVGTCAWFFFLINLTKVVPFWKQGMLNPETLAYGLTLSPAAIGGGVIGLWLLPRLSQRWFNLLVWVLSGGTALWLILG